MPKKVRQPGEGRYAYPPPPAIKAGRKCPKCHGERTYLDKRTYTYLEGNVKRRSTEDVFTCLDCWAVWK